MEAMAIAAAIVITPPSTPLEIHTDSKTAIHMMHRVVAPIASRELYNSPDAFIWLHLRSWLQSRGAPVTLQWVRGHSGDAGNEKADRLAASAHNDHSVTQWTTRMPPPLEAPFWIMHDGRVIQRRPRRLLREQDEAITSEQLVKQVNAVPDRPDQTCGGSTELSNSCTFGWYELYWISQQSEERSEVKKNKFRSFRPVKWKSNY